MQKSAGIGLRPPRKLKRFIAIWWFRQRAKWCEMEGGPVGSSYSIVSVAESSKDLPTSNIFNIQDSASCFPKPFGASFLLALALPICCFLLSPKPCLASEDPWQSLYIKTLLCTRFCWRSRSAKLVQSACFIWLQTWFGCKPSKCKPLLCLCLEGAAAVFFGRLPWTNPMSTCLTGIGIVSFKNAIFCPAETSQEPCSAKPPVRQFICAWTKFRLR